MEATRGDRAAARLRAWAVKLLSLAVEAFAPEAGEVVGCGLALRAGGVVLHPDAAFIASETGTVALAVLVWRQNAPAHLRERRRSQLARAGVLEYWELHTEGDEHKLYQLNANGSYDPIPPDAEGMYYSAAIEALCFPVVWLRSQPGLLEMMQAWGLIESA